MRVGTCVIGVGRMGANHARALAETPEAELLAIADPDEKRAAELAARFGCRHYASHIEMLEKEQPQAVILAVPTPFHLAVAADVIARGCHILVEKPLAATSEQARELIHLAREGGVRLAVGHIERFNPAVRKLKQLIGSGLLGDILSVSARRVGLPSPHHQDTNVVVDLAVHDLDVMRFLLGERPRIISSVTGRLTGGPSEDYADILAVTGEVPCMLQVNWVTPVKVRGMSIVGSAGYAELNYISQRLELFHRQQAEQPPSYKELVAKYGDAARDTVYEGGEEPLKAELRSFFQAIMDGVEPEASGEDGLVAVELAEEILDVAVRVGNGSLTGAFRRQ